MLLKISFPMVFSKNNSLIQREYFEQNPILNYEEIIPRYIEYYKFNYH